MTNSPDSKSAGSTRSAQDAEPPRMQPPVSLITRFLRRIIGGVLFILPIAITGFVIYQIYRLLNLLVEPLTEWIIRPAFEYETLTEWKDHWKPFETYVTPPITLVLVVLFLYVMGYLFQTRINHWIDWLFQHIPGVSTIYQAIRDVSGALQGPHGLKNIDTVVLVPFPHQHARMAGYLMGETENALGGEKLACVYIPIGIFPPSGYTLIFPQDQVTVTDWKATEVWKMLLSGGLTVPSQVPFTRRQAEQETP